MPAELLTRERNGCQRKEQQEQSSQGGVRVWDPGTIGGLALGRSWESLFLIIGGAQVQGAAGGMCMKKMRSFYFDDKCIFSMK